MGLICLNIAAATIKLNISYQSHCVIFVVIIKLNTRT